MNMVMLGPVGADAQASQSNRAEPAVVTHFLGGAPFVNAEDAASVRFNQSGVLQRQLR